MLDGHVGGGVFGGEGVEVGEDHGFGAVVAEGGFVVAADDGEGVEDVGGGVAGEAVEVEVEGVEAGAQMAALFFVPDEGRAIVAEVAGEGGDVVGGVGEAEDVVADEGAGGGIPPTHQEIMCFHRSENPTTSVRNLQEEVVQMNEILHKTHSLPQFELSFRSLSIDSLPNSYVVVAEEAGIVSMVV